VLTTDLKTAAGVGLWLGLRRCCVGAFAIWLERGVGDEDRDGEGSASIHGRRSFRMLGSCARNISGSTFSTADLTMSWETSTCTVSDDDAEVARSVGEGAHVRSWRRRFGSGESGVKLVRPRECGLAICRCCV
jgi:hypothetical protein